MYVGTYRLYRRKVEVALYPTSRVLDIQNIEIPSNLTSQGAAVYSHCTNTSMLKIHIYIHIVDIFLRTQKVQIFSKKSYTEVGRATSKVVTKSGNSCGSKSAQQSDIQNFNFITYEKFCVSTKESMQIA